MTALAIGRLQEDNKCSLYVGAAGGGVWVDRQGARRRPANWKFISGCFATNAIGSLLLDPADPSGNTLYAGTGEPNASADSEAGVGIYKTTDGGDTWSLVPAATSSATARSARWRSTSAGNLLVGVDERVRGVSSVSSGGAIGCSTPTTPPLRRPRPLPADGRDVHAHLHVVRPVGARDARRRPTSQLDPSTPSIDLRRVVPAGLWRSLDNGATWTQIKTALERRREHRPRRSSRSTSCRAARRGCTSGSATPARRATARASSAPTTRPARRSFTDMTTPQNIGYCTGAVLVRQRRLLAGGLPDVVYLGGSFDYGQHARRQQRPRVLLSTDGGRDVAAT